MNVNTRPLENYVSYRSLPQLAGLCSIAAASQPGLSIDHCVDRMKRFHYSFKRLHEILIARLTAEPIYELKMAFSLHAHYCAEHVAAIANRVGEMRNPPLGLEEIPDENLEILFDEILSAPSTEELIVGVYQKAIPALLAALQQYNAETNPLVDQPSVRIFRFALLELQEMRVYGEAALDCLVDKKTEAAIAEWTKLLDALLELGITGDPAKKKARAGRLHSKSKYVFDRIPKRDERFKDSYNAGVNAEAFLYNPDFPADAKTLVMFYKRLREIDVPEMMASIIHETPGKPWRFYQDLTRQLWDEARHAMMGEVGFIAAGVDWRQIPVNFTWSLNLNTQLTPIERHAVLFFIEQGLMPKTGKRYEWEVSTDSGNPLSMTIQDFDWADEVLHAAIGRRWYVEAMGDLKKALDYGDECWTKVVSDWKGYKERGLTEHRNWWPKLYAAACEHWGIEPDPAALAFAETYEDQRADLKSISASA